MDKEMFDMIDGLVHRRLLDEMVAKAYEVAIDVIQEEPFEIEDVLSYINAVMNERLLELIAE
jgi:hypothetical protein